MRIPFVLGHISLRSAHCEIAVVAAANTYVVASAHILRDAVNGPNKIYPVSRVIHEKQLIARLHTSYRLCREHDDPVNGTTPVIFPEVSSVRFAVKVVLSGGYRVDWLVPVQEALWAEGISVADMVPMSSLTHPEVLIAYRPENEHPSDDHIHVVAADGAAHGGCGRACEHDNFVRRKSCAVLKDENVQRPEAVKVRVACQLPFSWALGVMPPLLELPPPQPTRNVADGEVRLWFPLPFR